MQIFFRLRYNHQRALQGLSTAWLLFGSMAISVWGQSVCLPLPRLLTTMPMGGQAGTQCDVTISGEYIDGTSALLFTHPGITAIPKVDSQGNPLPNQFTISIAADCPLGIHEARVMTRLGISSSRVFCVDALTNVVKTEANQSLATAKALPINSICNAVMTNKAMDHYTFEAKKGQRYSIGCQARGIDSKLDAVLVIADAKGRDLVVERRGGTIDFVAPEDGMHVIKVHELTFKGGPGYFYRLALQEIPSEAPLPIYASTKPVNAFSWPPQGLPDQATSHESEPNAPDKPQAIELPCDLTGSFFPAADVDVFEFTAKKGEVWWIEVASERLGRPTDPAIVIQQVKGTGEQLSLSDVIELTDIAPPMKPSSNGYAYDGPPYDGGSADIIGKFEPKEDGTYRLQLTDLFGGTRNDAGNVYRLIIRQAAPDFALAAWGLHMELRNGDRNALSKPLALRAGITTALEVVAVRRDGFDGDIELMMSGLPSGVSAQGLKIPKGQTRGVMLVTAAQDAPQGMSEVTFTGTSSLNGNTMTRPVHVAAMAWPVADAWSEIPQPRLVAGLPISVTTAELAPFSIRAKESKVWEATVGQKLAIPLVHSRRSEFSGAVLQLKTSGAGFEKTPRFDVNLTAESSEAVLDLAALKVAPGDYLIAFYGSAVAKYRYNVDAVTEAELAQKRAQDEVTAATAEVQRLTTALASTPAEKKSAAEQAVMDAQAKLKSAEATLKGAADKLKTVSDQAKERDTVDIVMSEPIAIRVKPAETP